MTILYFIGALLIFSLIVIVHELGHFLSARALGVYALEFAVGMGPKIFSHQGKHTLFSLRAIPMGGFCSFEGEDDGQYDSPNAMNNLKPWKRFIIIASGPIMNFVLAYLVVVCFFMFPGAYEPRPLLAQVEQHTPAAEMGLIQGDIIHQINDEQIPFTEAGMERVRQLVLESAGQEIVIQVQRSGDIHAYDLSVPAPDAEGRALIGIMFDSVRVRYNLFRSMRGSVAPIVSMMKGMIEGIKEMFSSGKGLEGASGPIGVLTIMTQQIRDSWEQTVVLIVLISMNLGLMNLLPLPALDGGRLVFIAIEWITGKKLKPELEGWVHGAGFLLLIGLMLFISYQDIARLITGGNP